MSNINKLTNKIIEDANATASRLIAEAKAKETEVVSGKVDEAEVEKKMIISKAESEAKIKAERIVSNAHLQVRNMRLTSKGEALDKVFSTAAEKLIQLPSDKVSSFIKNSILSLEVKGDEEIVVGENNTAVTPEFISELNKELNAKGKIGNLKLSSVKRNIGGGFILIKSGVEINFTFEALIKVLRDELEAEVASTLFS
jgi:V/A-type H+-transporting ATPase subunit E